jgi:hypothetical protein
MWLTIGVWLCGLAATACTASVVFSFMRIKRGEAVVLATINGLGDTHLMAIEVLSMDIDRLKHRVADLESWRNEP